MFVIVTICNIIMKKFYCLLLIVWFAACSDDTHDWRPTDPKEPASSTYAVSVETALARLESALGVLYGDGDETRAAARPRVASIRSLTAKELALPTRSAAVSDADTLLYVVAFEENAGSAVLGADTRVEEIYAILDETVLTAEDIAVRIDDDISDQESDIVDFVAHAIVVDAISRIDEGDTVSGGPSINDGDDGGFLLAPTYRHVEVDVFRQAPLTKTKWHQDFPYNNDCPPAGAGRCVAGCVPVAAAQLLAYNQSGSTITVGGASYSWSLINQFNYGCYIRTDAAIDEIARFIHAVGVRLHTSYGAEESFAFSSYVPGLLNESGLRNARLVSYNSRTGRNMVCSEKKPFLMRGETASGEGHAWIIDGWNEYTDQCWETTYGPNRLIKSERLITETYYCMLHCNYGWGGICDGYYTDGLFDTTQRRTGGQIDTGVGDYAYTGSSNYTEDFKMITYDK